MTAYWLRVEAPCQPRALKLFVAFAAFLRDVPCEFLARSYARGISQKPFCKTAPDDAQ
jgi:hypothetical protein